MKNKVQLITYPDSLGGDLRRLRSVLAGPLKGLFPGGVHILPPFPSSGDRGFAPTNYFEIEPRFGTIEDLSALCLDSDVMVDMMVNHISRSSPSFQDFESLGRASRFADLFLTLDKIWPDGQPVAADVARVFLRKPGHPFSDIAIRKTGQVERIWTSFGPRVDWSEQIDLDINSELTRDFFHRVLSHFAEIGISFVRLDAIGYVIKKPGTDCFMVEPEVFDFLAWIEEVASGLGLELLPEVHDHFSTARRIADHGHWTYDFVLPGLILHSLVKGDFAKLSDYLRHCPRRQITMLDCHDGIPIQPDLDGILSRPEAVALVDHCLANGANINRILSTGGKALEFDAHQINITYYSALAEDDDLYMMARALQFFAPGVPQVYYVGMLAGKNDHTVASEGGQGREINRHNFSEVEIDSARSQPIVQRLARLIRFRNDHPSFDGDLRVVSETGAQMELRWSDGDQYSLLVIDLEARSCSIEASAGGGRPQIWSP